MRLVVARFPDLKEKVELRCKCIVKLAIHPCETRQALPDTD